MEFQMLGRFLRSAALIALLPGLWALAIGSPRAETLVIAGWGGPYEAELRKRFFPRFERKYSAKIEWLSASSFQNYGRIKAQRDNPQVDLLMADDTVVIQAGRDGLLAPVDQSIVKHLGDVEPAGRMKDDLGVGIGFNVVSLYYNAKVFKEKGFPPLTSWMDLFRPELKERIVIRNVTSSYGLYPLLMLAKINGGDEKNIDVGFRKMKELAPSVLAFPTSHGEQAQLTLREDVWVGVTGMGEMQAFLDRNAPLQFVIPKEGTLALIEAAAVVKGARQARLAQQFLDEILSPEGQHDMAIALSWRPTSTKTMVNDEIRQRLPLDVTKPLNLAPIDFEMIMANREAWTERFAKEVIGR
jgi:putative spermidine/putrescine transport system substrate-binding protein